MKTYIVKVDDCGTNRWYLDDKLHRENGPAIEWVDGTKCWCLNGVFHRVDGPAIEYANGSKEWYLGGVKYTEANWRKQLQKTVKTPCVGKIVEVDGVKYKLVEA
jgi:hypothetical protein